MMTVTSGASTSLDPVARGPVDATGEKKCLDVPEKCWNIRDRTALLSPGTDLLFRGCNGQSLGAKLGAKGNKHSGLSYHVSEEAVASLLNAQ